MLTPPSISDTAITDALRAQWGLEAARLAFLPIGADVNTAVYRVSAAGQEYFLKLRSGPFSEITVRIPAWLSEHGSPAIIAPLAAGSGELWGRLGAFRMILYPYIEGVDAYAQPLTADQWVAFGRAMRAVHDASLPANLRRRVPVEDFTPRWRSMVRTFLVQVERTPFADPAAQKYAGLLSAQRAAIIRMLDRADALAESLKGRALPYVLCHSDIHPGNLHLTPEGALYIVDWDAPIYAPRERDLMLVGGCPTWPEPWMAETFFTGYSASRNISRPYRDIPVDPAALAYYRYERIIWDLAAYCEALLLSTEGGADREQSVQYAASNFLPGHELEIAARTDGYV